MPIFNIKIRELISYKKIWTSISQESHEYKNCGFGSLIHQIGVSLDKKICFGASNGFIRHFTNDYSNTDKARKNSKSFKVSNDHRCLTLEEALYCAKEAGISTKTEIQRIIMSSPSFSPNRNPFLIENMFTTSESNSTDTDNYSEDDRNEKDEDNSDDEFFCEKTQNSSDKEKNEYDFGIGIAKYVKDNVNIETATELIDNSIIQNFNRDCNDTFRLNGHDWLVRSEGQGTRKRATAHVIIQRGIGEVRVNRDEDLYSRWPYIYNRMDVLKPFYLTNTAGFFDVFIAVKGGGISGQSAATRLAIARALLNACPACSSCLQEDLALFEDLRQKMPKMPGRKSARKQKSWSKR